MLASRTAFQATRRARIQPIIRTARRLESRYSSRDLNSRDNTAPAIIGGIIGGFIGGSVVALFGYAYYHYSGAATVVNTAHDAMAKFEDTHKKTTERAPDRRDATWLLRQTALSYMSFIPGANYYVNSMFDDIEAIQRKHEDDVNQIVKEAYNQLKDISTTEGVGLETVPKAWDVIQTAVRRIGSLAGDAAGDILNNHPELKSNLGGNIDQLKGMGESFGPEAKGIVDDTWEQVEDVLNGGIGPGKVDELWRLIQVKIQEVRRLGDQAWQKGLEQVKPYIDKNPKIKELLEQNKEKLMQGNLVELWEKVRLAALSGDVKVLERFIEETADKTKGKAGGGLEEYLNLIPAGGEIMPKLQQLQQIAENHGSEAQRLANETVKEIGDVLSRKAEETKRLADKASQEVKGR